MSKLTENVRLPSGNAVLGGILILLGIVFLIGQVFDIHLGGVIWPFLVITPGVLLFLAALAVEDAAGEAMVAVGSIITMVGLILLFQSVSGYWATWAYAWALVAPTSIGLGHLIYGRLKNRPKLMQSGRDLTRVGLVIFVVAAVFFELIIGISGFGLGGFIWPVLLIVLGLYLLLRNMGANWRRS
jgi:hypothetical protein